MHIQVSHAIPITSPYTPPHLPPKNPKDTNIETRKVLKQLTKSHSALAELKGVADSVPNKSTLIENLSLREARESRENHQYSLFSSQRFIGYSYPLFE